MNDTKIFLDLFEQQPQFQYDSFNIENRGTVTLWQEGALTGMFELPKKLPEYRELREVIRNELEKLYPAEDNERSVDVLEVEIYLKILVQSPRYHFDVFDLDEDENIIIYHDGKVVGIIELPVKVPKHDELRKFLQDKLEKLFPSDKCIISYTHSLITNTSS